MELLHKNITASILQSFFNVAKILSFGLDKSFYINALANDIRQADFSVQTNKLVDIFYNDNVIGQLNFGQEADYKRLFLSNDYKQLQQSRGSGGNGLLP